jgi:copper chaperone CopZ
VSVALRKIPAVESVETSLNQGRAAIKLKPENTTRLEDLIQKIRDNGFTPIDAKVTARGRLAVTRNTLQFNVSGVNQTYEVVVPPGSAQTAPDLRSHAGRILEIQGNIALTKGKAGPAVIELTRWQVVR